MKPVLSGVKFVWSLLFAGAVAPCIVSPETSVPTTNAVTKALQNEESRQGAKGEVSVEETASSFKIRVNLVQVHAVVRDGQGKPVGGLRKEDFQLYDNGRLQAISTFAIENDQSRKERTEAALKTQVNNEGNAAQVAGVGPERFIALTLDDRHLLTIDVAPLTKAADGFIDSIGPMDRVGIFTTSGLLTQDFTNDKELLKQTVSKVMSRTPVDWVSYGIATSVKKESQPEASIPQLPQSLMTSSNSLKEEGDEDIRIEFQELGNTLRLLGSKPGERVLLLASPGYILPVSLRYFFFLLVDRASGSDVVINTLDARGLDTPDVLGDISQPGSDSPRTAGQAASARLEEQFEQQFLLMDFANCTGGRFFHNSNDLEGGLKQLGNAPEVSYVLGFSPQNPKMDGHFHTLGVSLTGRQKYTVQARRGYFAPKKMEDPEEIAKEEIREAVFSRDEIVGLPFTTQTQYFKSEDGEVQLRVVAHIDLSAARFREDGGRNLNDVTVATVLFDEDGNFVAGGEKLVKLRLFDTSLERFHRTGLFVKSTYQVKPGKYLVRQVVREFVSSQISAHSGTVVIPN